MADTTAAAEPTQDAAPVPDWYDVVRQYEAARTAVLRYAKSSNVAPGGVHVIAQLVEQIEAGVAHDSRRWGDRRRQEGHEIRDPYFTRPCCAHVAEAEDELASLRAQLADRPWWWLLSRPCYDKPRRCPGWAGGGWRHPRVKRCDNGRTDVWEKKPAWTRYWRFLRCDTCNVLVWPLAVQLVDPTWWSWRVRRIWR